MRITELRSRNNEAFADADTYSRDTVYAELGGLTVNEALAAGQEPGDIWHGVLAHNPELPASLRFVRPELELHSRSIDRESGDL